MDVGDEFTIPNPFGLLPREFGMDMDSYRIALGFLSDLAAGTPQDDALQLNGGDQQALRGWQGSDRFRRVYAKCKAAGAAEMAAQARVSDPKDTDTDEGAIGSGQRFIPLEDMPVQSGLFRGAPSRASWGEA